MRFVLLPLILAGCAATIQVGSPAPDPDPTIIGAGSIEPDSSIIIYRASEGGFVANVASAPALLLNGDAVGTCRIGQPLVIRIGEGSHRIGALTASGEVEVTVDLEAGETEYLRCGTEGVPSLSPKPRLARVDAATASREAGL